MPSYSCFSPRFASKKNETRPFCTPPSGGLKNTPFPLSNEIAIFYFLFLFLILVPEEFGKCETADFRLLRTWRLTQQTVLVWSSYHNLAAFSQIDFLTLDHQCVVVYLVNPLMILREDSKWSNLVRNFNAQCFSPRLQIVLLLDGEHNNHQFDKIMLTIWKNDNSIATRFLGQFIPVTCGCAQCFLRRKVLEGDMTKYSCFRKSHKFSPCETSNAYHYYSYAYRGLLWLLLY